MVVVGSGKRRGWRRRGCKGVRMDRGWGGGGGREAGVRGVREREAKGDEKT